MTREEANIQDAIHCVKVDLEEAVCEECRLYGLCHTICKDADRIKLEALEKQIPKKVDNKIRRPNCLSGTCPVCGRKLIKDKFCSRCGQKLDWSENDEE